MKNKKATNTTPAAHDPRPHLTVVSVEVDHRLQVRGEVRGSDARPRQGVGGVLQQDAHALVLGALGGRGVSDDFFYV